MNKAITIIVIIAILIVAGVIISRDSEAPTEQEGQETVSPQATPTPTVSSVMEDDGDSSMDSEQNTVIYTDDGYLPSTLEITAGTTVTFRNDSSRPTWPASAIHPTHKVYPGSDIQKCGTVEEDSLFDACERVEPEQSWSFQFNEEGTWRYHDHLRPSETGTIIVN